MSNVQVLSSPDDRIVLCSVDRIGVRYELQKGAEAHMRLVGNRDVLTSVGHE